MPRGSTHRKPQPPADDDHDDQPIVRRTQAAAGTKPPPTSAAASIFALGAGAKPKRASPVKVLDVAIHSGVPIPEPTRSGSPYKALLLQMKAGDMVELPPRQAYGLLSAAKKLDITTVRRSLANGNIGVWRV